MSETPNISRENMVNLLEELAVVRIHHKPALERFLSGEDEPLSFESLGIDSHAGMEICIAIEMEYGISISPDELIELESIRELVSYLNES